VCVREEKWVNAEMKATMWATHPRRILALTCCSATLYSVVNAHSAFGATTFATSTTSTPTNSGVLIGLGAGVIVIGGVGFVVMTYARKKRRPSQCGEQRDALASAERALQYWEGALAHIQTVDRDRLGARRNGAIDGEDPNSAGPSDVDHESLRTKSQSGYAAAVKYRDQCQLDLIHCMASGGGKSAPLGQLTPQQPSIPFDQQ
jgi:hypothetical protein